MFLSCHRVPRDFAWSVLIPRDAWRRCRMKQFVASVLLAGAVAMLPNPAPADAREDKLAECMAEAIESCDKDFDGNEVYVVAARGYCYMIRTGLCYVFDPKTK